MIGRTIFAGAVLLGTGALAEPVVHATQEDCAVIVAVAKSQLKTWSAHTAPDFDFVRIVGLEDGGTFVEDCPWHDYGLAEPTPGTSKSPRHFTIARPSIAGRRASAAFGFTVRTPLGDKVDLWVDGGSCVLRKRGRDWRVERCSEKVWDVTD